MKKLQEYKGLNWQTCEDNHKKILHRDKFCPLCLEKAERMIDLKIIEDLSKDAEIVLKESIVTLLKHFNHDLVRRERKI